MLLSRRSEKIKKGYIWDWLEDESLQKKQCFTYPQINPTLALLETVSSLDRKVPYLHGPPDSVVVLFTTKVGTKRFQVPSKAEFDLRDPSRPPLQYNFLHDNHLTKYLMNPCVKKRLLKKGLLTKEGDVKCTIKEFNEYRQWIRKLKLDVIEKEWRMSHAQTMDRTHSKNEEAELIKNNKDHIMKLYRIQLKKEILKKEKPMSQKDERETRTDLKKKEKEVLLKKQQLKRNEENEKRRQKREELEDEDKRYRDQILRLSKKNMKMREEKMKIIYNEKSEEIKMKVVDLFKRRQMYFSEKMRDEKLANIDETRKRKKSLERREKVYKKQHKQIEDVHKQYLNKNREKALKHLHEATLYFLKMQRRKECQIHKWREHLKSVEKREHILTYWRKLRSRLQKSSKRQSRWRSAWDINQTILNQSSEFLEDFKMEDEKPYLEQDGSFQEDEREEVSSKEEFVYEKTYNIETKDQSTETVFENIASSTPVNSVQNNRFIVSNVRFSRVEMERIRVVAIDIINAKLLSAVNNCLSEKNVSSIESLLNSEVTPELSIDILCYAKNLAAASLIKAGEHLGFNKNLIISIFGITPIEESILKAIKNEDDLEEIKKRSKVSIYQTVSNVELEKKISSLSTKQMSSQHLLTNSSLEVKPSFSLEVERFAKHISTLTLIRAGASLGFNSLEIVDAFGIEFKVEDFLPEIEKINQQFVKDLVKQAMMQAALSLGYTQVEAELATTDFNEEPTENAEITSYAKNMAAVSLIKAGISLGYDDLEIVSAFGIEVNGDLLKSIEHQKKDLVSNIVNKALMQAALNLGYSYSEAEVSLNYLNKYDQEDSYSRKLFSDTDEVFDADEITKCISSTKSLDQVSNNNNIEPTTSKRYDTEAKSKPRLEIAKHIAAISLIRAGISLGYDHLELVSAFGIELSEDLISKIDERYDEFISSMVKQSIIRAAISLGYNPLEDNINLKLNTPKSTSPFKKKHEDTNDSSIISKTLTAGNTLTKNQYVENSCEQFFNSCLDDQIEKKIQPSVSFQIEECANKIASLSLIRASVSLGYSGTEIALALNMSTSETSLVFSIEKKYNQLVSKMVKEALKEAALSLGYTQEEAEFVIFNSPSSSDNLKTKKLKTLKVISCESMNSSGEILPCLSNIHLSRVMNKNYNDKSPKKSSMLPGIESFSNTFLTGTSTCIKPRRVSSEFPSISTTSPVLPSLTTSLSNVDKASNDKNVSDITHLICSPSSQLNITKSHRHLVESSDSLFMTEEPEVVLKNPADFEENKSLFEVKTRPLYLKKKDLRKTVSHHLTTNERPKFFRYYSTGRLQSEAGGNDDVNKQLVTANKLHANVHEKTNKNSQSSSIKLESKSTFIQNPTLLPTITSQNSNKSRYNKQSPYKSHTTNNLAHKAQSSSKLKSEFLDQSCFELNPSKPVSVSLNTGLRQVRRIEKGCNISLKNLILSNKKHVDSGVEHSKSESESKCSVEKPAAPSLNNFVGEKTEEIKVIGNKQSWQPNQVVDEGHIIKQSENKSNHEMRLNALNNKQAETINDQAIDQKNNQTTPVKTFSLHSNFKRSLAVIHNRINDKPDTLISMQNAAANTKDLTSNKTVSSEPTLTPSPPLVSKPHYLYYSQSVKTMTNNNSLKELIKCKSLDSGNNFINARLRPFQSHDKESIMLNKVSLNKTRKKKSTSTLTETILFPQLNSRDKILAPYTKPVQTEPIDCNSITDIKYISAHPVEPLNSSTTKVDGNVSSTNQTVKTPSIAIEKLSSHEAKIKSTKSNPDRIPYDNPV
ncbi:repetitive organellar protein isoform X2 [Hydra vulgaris]|uniref:repetitive organellar protein isoform X2 n=1 Tax=Hydra vulgaris TaxID=6087 RepID=UPI0032E9D6BD